MFYDISALAIWEILALALGLIVGWLTCSSGAKASWFTGGVRIALVLFVFGLILAVFHWPLNRAGFWLEAALLMFVAYIIGCFVGGWLRPLVSAPKEEQKAADLPAPRAPVAAAPAAVVAAASGTTSAAVSAPAEAVEATSSGSSVGGATVAGLAGASLSALATPASVTTPAPEPIAAADSEGVQGAASAGTSGAGETTSAPADAAVESAGIPAVPDARESR